MLLVRLFKDGLVLQQLLHLGEERLLLVIVVGLDEFVPDQSISDKIGLVLVQEVWCLLVDGVVAAEDRVVQERHMGCAGRKDVGLFGLVLRSGDELHGPIGPGMGRWNCGHLEGSATEEEADDHERDRENEGGSWTCHLAQPKKKESGGREIDRRCRTICCRLPAATL